MNKRELPNEAIIAITYRCNSRCQMCSIWKKEKPKDINPDLMLKLPKTLKTINITGGEPFLHPNLLSIIRNIIEINPKSNIVISTNGFLYKTILKMMPTIIELTPSVGIALSIDGIEEIHDKIRGVPNGFSKVKKTLKGLLKLNFFNIRIAMTFSKTNYHQIMQVYDFSQENNIEFTGTFVHESEEFFGITNEPLKSQQNGLNEMEINGIINKELKKNKIKNWGRAFFFNEMIKNFNGKKLIPICPAGNDWVFINPNGDVFPCHILKTSLGNLYESNFPIIWTREESIEIRNNIKSCNKNCWMVCNVLPWMKENKFKILIWALKRKFTIN